MPKPLHFSLHAVDAVAIRDLDTTWVERAVHDPAWTEADPGDPTVERRFRAIPEFGDRILRVACREDADSIFVISCLFDRRARPPQ